MKGKPLGSTLLLYYFSRTVVIINIDLVRLIDQVTFSDLYILLKRIFNTSFKCPYAVSAVFLW